MHEDGKESTGRIVSRAAIFLAGVVVLFVLWKATSALLLVFAGLVLAAALSFASDGLHRLTRLPTRLAKIFIYLAAFGAIFAVIGWGGATLAAQASDLLARTDTLMRNWGDQLSQLGFSFIKPNGDVQLSQMMPNLKAMMGDVGRVVSLMFGSLANAVIVVFLGIFVSWSPRTYRDGFLHLVPVKRRDRFREVIEGAAENLGWWMAGQAISMTIIFSASWIVLWLIDMPYAFLLALQAGLLAFIPTLGPAIAGVVIILAGLSVSATMALWGVGAYVLIQGLESNITQPLVQQRTTSLPPALTLSTQLVFAAVLGGLGMALAVPLLAVGIVFVRELYVKDTLEGGDRLADDERSAV
ncbi:AI-2E family transporter [Afifella marina]|uniref:Predicted PurR-regulated permease PerM n=1 Tax=Afifella marina DSM 2698 TaxID=1120955 RepID=A0A1G5MB21_AFIMA|nr:AI-2E family transporter [Afifella marina]SCZ21559.1 Predicted PurR-regulated permease PerM [Afifella marina DSM 2698]